ncbi:MAG: hypothetical protein EBX50_20890 [Chitinophagia bacterium]|nr:hypothetical protein [Chitinophagia bacterium]
MGLLQPWHLPPFSYESQHIVFKVKKKIGTGTDATDEFTRSHWIDIVQNSGRQRRYITVGAKG